MAPVPYEQMSDGQRMMLADGMPASLILSSEERAAAWAANPPRVSIFEQTRPGTMATYETKRNWWLHQLAQLRAKANVHGANIERERKAAQRELAKLRAERGGRTLPRSAPAAVRVAAATTPRPAASAPIGHRAGAGSMAVVSGIDKSGLVTAEDLGRDIGLPAKVVRRLLRTHKPVPKPSWGWSFDEETANTVRNWLRTKTDGKSVAVSDEAKAVSREEKNAPAKQEPRASAGKSKQSRRRTGNKKVRRR